MKNNSFLLLLTFGWLKNYIYQLPKDFRQGVSYLFSFDLIKNLLFEFQLSSHFILNANENLLKFRKFDSRCNQNWLRHFVNGEKTVHMMTAFARNPENSVNIRKIKNSFFFSKANCGILCALIHFEFTCALCPLSIFQYIFCVKFAHVCISILWRLISVFFYHYRSKNNNRSDLKALFHPIFTYVKTLLCEPNSWKLVSTFLLIECIFCWNMKQKFRLNEW